MPMMPEVYMATVFVTAIVITALGIGFVALFFIPEIGVIDLWESQQDPASEAPCFSGSIGILTELMSPNQRTGVLITRRKSSRQF